MVGTCVYHHNKSFPPSPPPAQTPTPCLPEKKEPRTQRNPKARKAATPWRWWASRAVSREDVTAPRRSGISFGRASTQPREFHRTGESILGAGRGAHAILFLVLRCRCLMVVLGTLFVPVLLLPLLLFASLVMLTCRPEREKEDVTAGT